MSNSLYKCFSWQHMFEEIHSDHPGACWLPGGRGVRHRSAVAFPTSILVDLGPQPLLILWSTGHLATGPWNGRVARFANTPESILG